LPGDRNLKFQRFSRISLPGVALQPEHLGPNQLHYAALGQTPVVIRFPSGSINDLLCCHGLFSSKIQDSCDRYSVTKNFAHHEHYARALAKLAVNGSVHLYEVRPRKDPRGVDLISDALPFGRLWYAGPNAVSNAIGYAQHRSRSHDAVIRVCDEAGNVIETHEHKGEFKK